MESMIYYIPENSSIVWSLQGVLKMYKSLIIIDSSRGLDLNSVLWKEIRSKRRSLLPVIVFNFIPEDKFLNDIRNLAFREREFNYAYLSYPISLLALLKTITRLQPLRDEFTLDSHIRKYTDKNGILRQIAHNLNNAILSKNLERIRRDIQEIVSNLSFFDEYSTLLDVVQEFTREPSIDLAKKILKEIEWILEEQ